MDPKYWDPSMKDPENRIKDPRSQKHEGRVEILWFRVLALGVTT